MVEYGSRNRLVADLYNVQYTLIAAKKPQLLFVVAEVPLHILCCSLYMQNNIVSPLDVSLTEQSMNDLLLNQCCRPGPTPGPSPGQLKEG